MRYDFVAEKNALTSYCHRQQTKSIYSNLEVNQQNFQLKSLDFARELHWTMGLTRLGLRGEAGRNLLSIGLTVLASPQVEVMID